MPSRLVLVGAGGHARACIDVIEQAGVFRIDGLIGLASETGSRVLGHTVVGTDSLLERLDPREVAAFVAIGQILQPMPRIAAFERLGTCGFQRPVILSPRGYVSPHARVGEGTIIMHGAIVNAGAVIGRNCIINTSALIEHDAQVGDHCHISTHAVLNGGARVLDRSFIGSGCIVRENVQVGADCVVGMGQCIRRDCADHQRLPPQREGT
jgi:sugar O-acyltransferase (sialic acid O-acetyltransferase NeuD family)